MHAYKHRLGCMPTHMLQTSHVWLLKPNKSHHASMVTKGTTCDAWFQKRDNMACMVTKKGQHGYFVHVWNFMTCEATRQSKRPINTMVCQASHPCKSLQKKSSKKILTQTNPPQTHPHPTPPL